MKAAIRLLQHRADDGVRSVILAIGGDGWFLKGPATIHDLAMQAIANEQTLASVAQAADRGPPADLPAELAAGRLVTPIAHEDPAHVFLTGTGLTHLGSAEGRDKMHRAAASGEQLTDSMRIFLEGLEGGKPAPGKIGQQPEWFYKGNGTQLVNAEQPLTMPSFAKDGGEEPELAGIYLIGPDGTPWRLGYCLANEFSDHVTERHNYLWLAHSKLRQAALGPELLLGKLPGDVTGISRIWRDGEVLWEKPFSSGEANMSHSLANLEHHHFKYDIFRQPGDVHIHFFGTATLSFSEGIETRPGDVFEIEAAPFTLPLRNTLRRGDDCSVMVREL